MSALPPSILSPAASEAVAAVEGAADRPSPSLRHWGEVLSVTSTVYTVHLFADPAGHNIVCGAEVAGATVGKTVAVGFFDDLSVSIVGVAA